MYDSLQLLRGGNWQCHFHIPSVGSSFLLPPPIPLHCAVGRRSSKGRRVPIFKLPIDQIAVYKWIRRPETGCRRKERIKEEGRNQKPNCKTLPNGRTGGRRRLKGIAWMKGWAKWEILNSIMISSKTHLGTKMEKGREYLWCESISCTWKPY